MNIIFKRLKNLYIKLFFLSPKFISSIIFIPFLYLFGWLLATPILLFGVNKDSLSLIGTIITFLIFFFSLPKWFEIRWGLKNTWTLLGVKQIERNIVLIFYFLRGLLLSTILISLILIPIIGTQSGFWTGKISSEITINAILPVEAIIF